MTEAASFRLKVTGLPEILKKLDALKVDTEKAVAAALLASAFVVSNDAKRRAPRKTGNLARSITPGVGTDPGGTSGPITQTQGGLVQQSSDSLREELGREGQATAYVATNVVYATTQEFLPYEHEHGFSPYMRPAMDENHEAVTKKFKDGLLQVIKSAGG
jgi:HK97 gp10 family phage protein